MRRGSIRRSLVLTTAALLTLGAPLGTTAAALLPEAAHSLLPAAVPAPGPTESVVTVRVGGDRSGPTSVAPLQGVVLGLFATATDAAPVDPVWGTCTSDADGDCSFVVPDTATTNAGVQLWVKQISAPAGWYTNPSLRTGPGNGSGSVDNPYVFQTPALVAGAAYSSLSDFMAGPAGSGRPESDSEGVWQQSRVNPLLPATCGLDVALVMDLSASVSSSELVDLKAAADTFADSLVGSPSRMALFSFDGSSPSTSVGTNYPALRTVATQSGADQVKATYAGWTTGSGTNWDEALRVVAEAAPAYELTVVITDGNPTRFGPAGVGGSGGTTHFRDVENGIYSANAVKAEGTRVIVLGVGDNVDTTTQLNLRALSGPTLYDGTNVEEADYYDAADYAAAGQALQALALAQCEGTVNVFKEIVPAQNSGDDVTGSNPAGAGWEFSTSSTSADVTVAPPSATTVDDGTGGTHFGLTYASGTPDADITVVETQQSGYELVSPAGDNAVCINRTARAALPVTNVDSATSPGFTIDVPAGAFVSCTVYNRASAGIVVDKRWVVEGVAYDEGSQPAGFGAALTLTEPGAGGATPQAWGAARNGYAVDEGVTVAETTTTPDDGLCTTRSAVTAVDGSAVDLPLPWATTATYPDRAVTVTNTVTCDARLTLVKRVVNDDGGSALPSAWTLTASGPTLLRGATGTPAVTAVVVTPGTYALTESEGPPGYTQSGWSCTDAGSSPVTLTSGSVTLDALDDVTCTVTNDDPEGALVAASDDDRDTRALAATGAEARPAAALAAGLLATGLVLSLVAGLRRRS